MKKKPFWRRVNRGFVVSMALLGAVVLYVIISQLMLIPDRTAVRQLTNDYRALMESTSKLSDTEIESLKSEAALSAEKKQLKQQLAGLFVKDSGYIDGAVDLLVNNIQAQTQGMQRITARDEGVKNHDNWVISEDVANATVNYQYMMSGEAMDYTTEKMQKIENETQRLFLSLNFKKENGVWKIYRISNAYWEDAGSIHMRY